MSRYVTVRPKAFDWSPLDCGPSQITAHEAEPEPVSTGLLDSHGRPLYRLPDTVPMGFHRGGPKA